MTIDKKKLAIVTPSYHTDYKLCKLLVDSVNRYADDEIKHYLIIPRKDYPLFEHMMSSRTRIRFQEDFLPWWIFPSLISKKWYASLKTFPVRGWIRQQIVKLAIGEMLPESFFLLVDSDTFLVRPFDVEAFFEGEKVSLYCEPLKTSIPEFDGWQRTSAKLFKIDAFNTTNDIYVAPFIFWRKDILLSMFRALEKNHGKSWQQVLCGQLRLSEYTLYGIYVDHVLGIENSGHYRDPKKHTHDYYKTTPMNPAELKDFKDEMADHHWAVSIASKSSTQINDIREVFGFSR